MTRRIYRFCRSSHNNFNFVNMTLSVLEIVIVFKQIGNSE